MTGIIVLLWFSLSIYTLIIFGYTHKWFESWIENEQHIISTKFPIFNKQNRHWFPTLTWIYSLFFKKIPDFFPILLLHVSTLPNYTKEKKMNTANFEYDIGLNKKI